MCVCVGGGGGGGVHAYLFKWVEDYEVNICEWVSRWVA